MNQATLTQAEINTILRNRKLYVARLHKLVTTFVSKVASLSDEQMCSGTGMSRQWMDTLSLVHPYIVAHLAALNSQLDAKELNKLDYDELLDAMRHLARVNPEDLATLHGMQVK